jgi:rod shape-determining protein MreB
MFGFRDIFTESIGIDLGTVNTLVAVKGSGIVLREPSAVALSTGRKREVLAVGSDAVLMLGRAPGSVYVEHPLKDGVVADYYLAESMLRHFIDKSLGRRLPGVSVRAVICVPGCITDVERRAVETAAKGAGAREAILWMSRSRPLWARVYQ